VAPPTLETGDRLDGEAASSSRGRCEGLEWPAQPVVRVAWGGFVRLLKERDGEASANWIPEQKGSCLIDLGLPHHAPDPGLSHRLLHIWDLVSEAGKVALEMVLVLGRIPG
jgi:hypothetical protein